MISNQIPCLLIKRSANAKVTPVEKVHKIPALHQQKRSFYEQKENNVKKTAAILSKFEQEDNAK
jgi:hypothetical protein